MWEIRIIHPAFSAARKTCGTAGERKMHFSSASTYPLPPPRQTGATHGPGLPGASRYCPGPSLAEGGRLCIRAARNQTRGFLCKKNWCTFFLPLVSSVRSLPTPLEGCRQGKGAHSCSLPRSAPHGLGANLPKISTTALSSSDAPAYFAFLSQGVSPWSNIFLRSRHSSKTTGGSIKNSEHSESRWTNQAKMLMQLTIPSSKIKIDWVNGAQKMFISLYLLARND